MARSSVAFPLNNPSRDSRLKPENFLCAARIKQKCAITIKNRTESSQRNNGTAHNHRTNATTNGWMRRMASDSSTENYNQFREHRAHSHTNAFRDWRATEKGGFLERDCYCCLQGVGKLAVHHRYEILLIIQYVCEEFHRSAKLK